MEDATPFDPAFAAAGWLAAFWQVWLGRASGRAAIERARRERLRELIAFARRNARFYRELYAALPDGVDDCAALPVTTKPALMARFDDWVTDPAVTRAAVERFLADRARVGERFLGGYVAWKSSGTSGDAGIFVQDRHALSTYDGLLAVQLAAPDLAARCVTGSLRGGRAALIAATGDHFASIASWERVCRASPAMNARGFSVMQPVGALVEKLNAFDPAYVASYPTMLALLAQEHRAGGLAIRPALAWSGGECLPPAMHEEIENAFGCRVMNEYGASEFLSIGYGCSERWIHVNDDWVVVEPVDRDHRPTPPGATSHTVLLSNLANFVQPILRYDLGDAVTVRDGPCPCGSRQPAIRVAGRRDDVVVLTDGDRVARIVPMALATVLEESTGVHRFQIVQRGPRQLAIRLDLQSAAKRRQAFDVGAAALRPLLTSHGVPHVELALDDTPPAADPRSGKLRQVIVERR